MRASTPDVVPGELAGMVAFAAFLGLVLLVAWLRDEAKRMRRARRQVQAWTDRADILTAPRSCHSTACPYPATVLAQIVATGQVVWYCPGDFDRHAAHGTVRRYLATTGGVA